MHGLKEWGSGNYFHILNIGVCVVKVTRTQKVENRKVTAETLSMTELLMSHKLRKSEI